MYYLTKDGPTEKLAAISVLPSSAWAKAPLGPLVWVPEYGDKCTCGQLCKELWLRRALGSRRCLKQPQPRGENGQLKASAGQKFSRGG